MESRCLAGAMAALLLALASQALAERVVVGPIRGDTGGAIGARIAEAIASRMEVVSWEDVQSSAQGARGSAIREACARARARAIIVGDVLSPRRLRLSALSCLTGELDVEQEVWMRGSVPTPRALRDALENLVPTDDVPGAAPSDIDVDAESTGTDIQSSEPPASPPARPAASTHAAFLDPRAMPSSFARGRRRRSAIQASRRATRVDSFPLLELSAGPSLATRLLTVSTSGGDRIEYGGGGWAELGLRGAVFPLGLATDGAWSRAIGLQGAGAVSVAMPDVRGTRLEAGTTEGSMGILGRLVMGPLELRPSLSYGLKAFRIDSNPDLASFGYRFGRLGIETIVALDRWRLNAELGYRVVGDTGEAATAYGRDEEAWGWDASLRASVTVLRRLELSVGADVSQFSATYGGRADLLAGDGSSDTFLRAFSRVGIVI